MNNINSAIAITIAMGIRHQFACIQADGDEYAFLIVSRVDKLSARSCIDVERPLDGGVVGIMYVDCYGAEG